MNTQKSYMAAAISLAVAGQALPAAAQIEEVLVTATKRSESAQDIPVAVQALTSESLDNRGISTFSDYLVQLPGVTAGGSGPGQSTIYIRGIASTTPNLTTAGVAGLAPNVAFYLDEHPLAQPGRNLDVYAADMSRIEVLSGPQGTLFGASSQAGTVRLITNKPDMMENYGKFKAGIASTSGGEPSYNFEAMYNAVITDNAAVRAVIYQDRQGGYIDNVGGSRDISESARFRPAGTVRANGVPVSAIREGFQAGADLSNVNMAVANNDDYIAEDINETTYTGGRIAASVDVSENWNVLVSYAHQEIESDGVFFEDEELDDFEIQRFAEDSLEDTFDSVAWTLTGMIGELEAVYTGAYTKREADQVIDYTDYMFVGQYLPYYICDYSVVYPGAGGPVGNCGAPNLYVDSFTKTEVTTHEFRISTDQSASIRATTGVFMSDLTLQELNDFTYPGSTSVDGGLGWVDNYSFDTGYRSDSGAYPEGVIFRNDIERTDKQWGVFGEVTFDLSDSLSFVLGARYFDVTVDMEGSANSSFCNRALFFSKDSNAFGTDISDLYNADGQYTLRNCTDPQTTYYKDQIDASTPANVVAALNAPDAAETSGTIFKGTVNWRPVDDQLYYVTLSEGFRPGLLNRPGGASNGQGYSVPYALDTDEVTNLEFGVKTDFFDRSVRFNANLFMVEIDRMQTTIFDPSITNLFFSDNAANAEVRGLEGELTWVPHDISGLYLSSAFSFLDTEITDVLVPTSDVVVGDSLAYAPEMQFTNTVRYEWGMFDNLMAHVQGQMLYSDEVYTDIITINRIKLDAWTMYGLTAGISADSWKAEMYVDNLSDERAQMSGNFYFDRARINYAKPRTIGLRVAFDF